MKKRNILHSLRQEDFYTYQARMWPACRGRVISAYLNTDTAFLSVLWTALNMCYLNPVSNAQSTALNFHVGTASSPNDTWREEKTRDWLPQTHRQACLPLHAWMSATSPISPSIVDWARESTPSVSWYIFKICSMSPVQVWRLSNDLWGQQSYCCLHLF